MNSGKRRIVTWGFPGVVCLGVVTLTERLWQLGINIAKFYGYSCFTNDWWNSAKSWSCYGKREQHTTPTYWCGRNL